MTIAASRQYDAIDRLIVFGEQLEVAVELLTAGTLAKARMALVAVDNLADLLLPQHADPVFLSGEGSWWYRLAQVLREGAQSDPQ